jgi:hypothetical protein
MEKKTSLINAHPPCAKIGKNPMNDRKKHAKPVGTTGPVEGKGWVTQ